MKRNILAAFAAGFVFLPVAYGAQSKAFNPDISTNFLGLLQRGTGISNNRSDAQHNGLSLQEAELQFMSDVDPYFRASALLSVAQESGSTDYGIDPEEVFLETISLPSVTVRAGKFKLAVDRHNQLHTHAFPFIDAPLINQTLLGDEGLNEAAVSVAALLPTPWFSEITVQGFDPGNGNLFNQPDVANTASSSSIGGLVFLKNLWDINDDLTAELGLSATTGKNSFDKHSSLFGGDLTFKWRPSSGGKYKALTWSTEYLLGDREGLTDANTGSALTKLGGMATWLQYQFAERWWIQGRYEYVGIPTPTALPQQHKESALLGFFPSEFSGFRLQYDHIVDRQRAKPNQTIALQYNISIGAHPAHAY